jgi:SAM-dependent methyltransferase
LVAGLASGSLLDVGTGRGQLPILLLELGRVSSARGIDWDDDKIAAAQRAAYGLNASFTRSDARTAVFEAADTVLLIDLLHYFTIEEQDAILERAAAAVRPGGRILVREADSDAGWRSAVTLLEERFFTSVRVNRGDRVCFRPARDLAARLEAAGLRCEVRRAWGKMPFSNVLVIGARAPGPESFVR